MLETTTDLAGDPPLVGGGLVHHVDLLTFLGRRERHRAALVADALHGVLLRELSFERLGLPVRILQAEVAGLREHDVSRAARRSNLCHPPHFVVPAELQSLPDT